MKGKRGTCSVCARQDVDQIDAELAMGGRSLRGVALRQGIAVQTLRNHAKGCSRRGKTERDRAAAVIDEIQERRQEILTTPAVKLADQAAIVDELRAMHERLDEEFKTGPAMLRLEASQEKRQILKLIGQMIRGQEEDRGEASIFETRQWREVEETILGALTPHERARLDVAAALAALRRKVELGA